VMGRAGGDLLGRWIAAGRLLGRRLVRDRSGKPGAGGPAISDRRRSRHHAERQV